MNILRKSLSPSTITLASRRLTPLSFLPLTSKSMPKIPLQQRRSQSSTTNPTTTTDLRTNTSYTSTSISDLMSLKDRVVVITGGGRGIGLALAYAVAQSGAHVAVLDALEEPHADFARLEGRGGGKALYYR
jgi:FlaA1/EpsC-like NDP-sugar epimerase